MTAAVNQETLDFLKLAARLGVPQDSIERFLRAGYIPQPKQLEFHAAARAMDTNDVDELMFGGGRGGAKTHSVFTQAALDDCQRCENLRVLFLRKQQGSAEETLDVLTRKILSRTPHKQTQTSLIFPNHSRIKIGNFQYEQDIDKYLSLEFDLIIIEQAEQLTQTKLIDIGTVNRNTRSDYKPRQYLTVNWGGVSHTYLKNKFVEPYRAGRETNTRFIPATVADNKKVNIGYLKKLMALTGWKREAWLNGSPDVFAGQFFENFNYDTHTADQSKFFPPEYLAANYENLQPWGSFDWGLVHWAVFYLGYKYDGTIYILDECAVRQTLDENIAKAITETCQRNGLEPGQLRNIAAGTDCFKREGQTGETTADVFAKHGVYLNSANTARQAGASKFLTLLGDEEHGIAPTIKISRRCKMLIEQLSAMEHDPNQPGDVKKTNTDANGFGGDDAYDSARYFIMDDTDSTGIF